MLKITPQEGKTLVWFFGFPDPADIVLGIYLFSPNAIEAWKESFKDYGQIQGMLYFKTII